ncbi:MAG: nicotinate-nucleotide--dimethylbenzimidazole phosphoribosyltransferase [Bacteroidota bacterium]|nr:nicotinate-nucleotide--dimethylbenzimidazole phosphoribosyltransferase [Odoribacter sp.]MDP3643315.1 nicotinate-nucleotide--dimethylbenzimidazole phosphoribosyltransferase [Bacteroidota bacterium]
MTLNEQLKHKINFKTKPLGALGLLEDLALQIGLIQNTLTPEIKNPALLVFAADHGLTDEGISSFPKEVTWQMVMNFVSGGAAINVFCRQNGINLKVVDAGVDFDFPEGIPVVNAKIARGTRNMRYEPAMTSKECAAALQKGRKLVGKEAEGGCNIIGFGEMGIGNTSPSSLLMHRFLNIPIEECTGSGTGMHGEQLTHKIQILKEVSEKYDPQTPEETLATFGGLEIAMMVGAMLEACDLHMILLIDGFIATAAALTAIQINPAVRDNCVFCHSSDERGHKLMLQHLDARPMLQLNLRLGEGTGAALTLPLVQAAVNFLNEMASFDDAGVSNK